MRRQRSLSTGRLGDFTFEIDAGYMMAIASSASRLHLITLGFMSDVSRVRIGHRELLERRHDVLGDEKMRGTRLDSTCLAPLTSGARLFVIEARRPSVLRRTGTSHNIWGDDHARIEDFIRG